MNIICHCYQMTKSEILQDLDDNLEILAGQACGWCSNLVEDIKKEHRNKSPEESGETHTNETKQ